MGFMGKGKKRPTIEAYFGIEAQEYGESQWMARNQIKTTHRAIQLLNHPQLGPRIDANNNEIRLLDLGCGTGYSSTTIKNQGYHVVGLDLSRDMISQNDQQQKFDLVQADIRHLPFRSDVFDHLISISAFNFITTGMKNDREIRETITQCFMDIISALKERGRVIIEFYPTDYEQTLFLSVLKNLPFSGGGLSFISNVNQFIYESLAL